MNKKLLFLLIPLLLATAKTSAQDIALNEFELEPLVVTATKSKISVKDVPAAVTIITAKDIQNSGAHTLKDIIAQSAGVAINRFGGREALSIRGFDARYSMILIDGKRIPAEPEPTYELERISFENVERIEIVRGPVTSLYGADALGGVVNIITKTSKKKSLTLTTSTGLATNSRETNQKYSFNYASGQNGKTSFSLAGSFFDADPLLKSDGTSYSTFGERKNLHARFDYNPTAEEIITFTASRLDENTQEYANLQTVMGTVKTNILDDNDRSQYSLSYTKNLPDGELYFNASHSIWNKYNDTINNNTNQYMNSIYGRTTISTLEGRLTKEIAPNHILTFGGEYRPELFSGTGIQTGEGTFSKVFHNKTYAGSEVKTKYSALYLQDQWTISPKLLAITAARYDQSDKFENKLSPKLGLTYSPNSDWKIKLNAAQGFRVPSPNQLYLNLNVTRNGKLVNLLGNQALHPESSKAYDLSIEHSSNNIDTKFTFFTSKLTDMIDETWLNSNTVKYQNINSATLKGFEAEIAMPLSKKISWSGNYTYLDATNNLTQERLYNRARHKLSTRLAYNPTATLQANLWLDSYIHYWFQPNASTKQNATYNIWNLNIQKQLNKTQTLALGIDNIFNHQDEALSIPGTLIHLDLSFKL